eukprot:COSAG06_NODE_77228_length_116_cov_506.352941_1_plen_23_part_01
MVAIIPALCTTLRTPGPPRHATM